MARPAFLPVAPDRPGPVPAEWIAAIQERQVLPVPEETLRGLLEPFGGRARTLLAVMLLGFPRRAAAAAAGMSDEKARR